MLEFPNQKSCTQNNDDTAISRCLYCAYACACVREGAQKLIFIAMNYFISCCVGKLRFHLLNILNEIFVLSLLMGPPFFKKRERKKQEIESERNIRSEYSHSHLGVEHHFLFPVAVILRASLVYTSPLLFLPLSVLAVIVPIFGS